MLFDRFENYQVRKVVQPIGASSKFWNKEENDVRRALLGEIGTAYSKNKSLLLDKAKYIRLALIATAVEVVLVVAALILYRLL